MWPPTKVMRNRFSLALCSAVCATIVVARPSSAVIPSEAYIEVIGNSSSTIWPWRAFKSSDQTPPNMTITGNGGALAAGYIFMTPQGVAEGNLTAKENGGFILTSDNELVYGFADLGITDFRAQYFNGKQYLTFWSGYSSEGVNVGHGYGQLNLLSDDYELSVIDPDLGLNKLTDTKVANWSIDIHEHQMTDRNTVIVSAYNNTQYDLTPVNGSADGWLVDGMFFDLDVATGEVLFSWKAVDHLPLNASHEPVVSAATNGTKAAPWDWFHINAVQAVGSDYLVNARHHWASYLVSGKDGSIIWSLEGETGGSFGTLPADGTFRWQHFARAHNVSATSLDISLFDNHNAAGPANGSAPSKGLVYHLELPASKSYTPQLLRKIETPSQELYADSQGSYDPSLSNGNQLLGYGQLAITREYGPATDGSDLRWQAQFGALNVVQSYRAFKETWCATPAAWNPSLVVEYGKVYVSWNGATEVSEWSVYAGTTKEKLSSVGVAAKKGFETVFDVPEGAEYVQVAALQNGAEVRKSNVAAVGS